MLKTTSYVGTCVVMYVANRKQIEEGDKDMAKKITKINPVKSQVMEQLQPKKRVCGYTQVSTDSKGQHSSFAAQVAYYKELIGRNEEWEYTGVYADKARSGTQLEKRDEFRQMIQDCERGRIDMIITKSITRFARNTVDSISTIRKLKALGVAVLFENENTNSLTECSEQMLTILSSMAQGESESISTNLRWAVTKRFQEGTFKISTPAYGYTRDESGELIIQEEEAEVVRHIFKEYLNGKGSYLIAKGLTEKGIPTIRSAGKWGEGVIKNILLNPVYAGNLILQKTYTTEVLPFQKKVNRGELPQYFISENHPPIISQEEAEAVTQIYEYRRKQMRADGSIKSQNRYAFSSRIICGECGAVFRRQMVGIGTSYERVQWSCARHIRNKEQCGQKPFRDEILKQAFTVMWNKLVSNYAEILIPLLDSLKRLRSDEEQEREINECDNKMMELTKQSHILSGIVAKGYIDAAVFIERQNALSIEQEMIRKKRNQLLDIWKHLWRRQIGSLPTHE